MSKPVKLRDVVNEMDLPGENWTVYFNKRTAEFVSVGEEDVGIIEDPSGIEDLPDWQKALMPKIREALTSADCVALPDKFEIHEWAIMERFSRSVPDAESRERLAGAIHGRGAFRYFRDELARLGIEEEWFRYRQKTLEEIAVAWLEENAIPFERAEGE